MTDAELMEEFIMDKLIEDPEFRVEQLTQDTTADEEWIKSQEKEQENDFLKQVYEGKLKKKEAKKQVADLVKPTGLSPVEAARQKATVKSKIKPPAPLGGTDEEFEDVFRETK
jgi:hypothetical protein